MDERTALIEIPEHVVRLVSDGSLTGDAVGAFQRACEAWSAQSTLIADGQQILETDIGTTWMYVDGSWHEVGRRKLIREVISQFIADGRLVWAQFDQPGVIDPVVCDQLARTIDEALTVAPSGE